MVFSPVILGIADFYRDFVILCCCIHGFRDCSMDRVSVP